MVVLAALLPMKTYVAVHIVSAYYRISAFGVKAIVAANQRAACWISAMLCCV